MCGIAGFLRSGSQTDPRRVLQRMTDSLRHRGPDDEGMYVDALAAVGVRRLAVIDIATGRQPIANEDGTIHGVLNGEIYNFQDLRARLERRGHVFRTRSDAEVIVHAYEESGEDCVRDLDGMFALAVWDSVRRRLLLARDRMGEKPLYYHASDDAFVFGSEVRALLHHPAVSRRLDLPALSRYFLFECIPAPHSIFADIRKLAPGHTLVVSPGDKPAIERYWAMEFTPDHSLDEGEWRQGLRAKIEQSVKSRLVSDVPLGVLVSGGVDSGTVAALAAQSSAGRLRTFSVGFEEPSYDERPFARRVAEHCGAEHEAIVFTSREAGALLERVGELLDEPLVDASFLPRHVLAQAARRSVTVVLSGDGGDELFCGYPTFLADRPARWCRQLIPMPLHGLVNTAVQRLPSSAHYASVDFLLKQFVRTLPYGPEVRTQLLLGGLTPAEQSQLFSPGLRAALASFDPYLELTQAIDESGFRDVTERLIYHHSRFYLADQTLVATDRATMAAGLEVRAPLLDHTLFEFAGRIPNHFKLRGRTTKYLLKRAVDDVLPADIVARRKQGLGVPVAAWLRGPLRSMLEERLAPDRIARQGLFEPATVSRLLAEHAAGYRNHRKVLWALLMFDAWCEHYLVNERWT
jgi:asparagine synthase (glutamine-hydrolysing)